MNAHIRQQAEFSIERFLFAESSSLFSFFTELNDWVYLRFFLRNCIAAGNKNKKEKEPVHAAATKEQEKNFI